jgi:hypothetical protein
LASETNESGLTVVRWYRWPLDSPGELTGEIHAECDEDDVQIELTLLMERETPEP